MFLIACLIFSLVSDDCLTSFLDSLILRFASTLITLSLPLFHGIIPFFLYSTEFAFYYIVEDAVETFNPETDTMAHLMVKAGAFNSVTLARKNGWNKPIPNGYSEAKVGKHTRIFIWNPK